MINATNTTVSNKYSHPFKIAEVKVLIWFNRLLLACGVGFVGLVRSYATSFTLDLEQRDDEWNTVLYVACSHGQYETAKCLIGNGAPSMLGVVRS